MSLAETDLAIEELEEEIRRENDRRYAFTRMLAATDRVPWRLEELNRDGYERISVQAWGRIRQTLSELPTSCLEVLADPPDVQALLDSVFDVQERLFRLRDPARDDEADAEEMPEPDTMSAQDEERFRAHVLRRLAATPEGETWAMLANIYSDRGAGVRARCRVVIDALEAEGLVRWEAKAPGRRYFAVGESGGG